MKIFMLFIRFIILIFLIYVKWYHPPILNIFGVNISYADLIINFFLFAIATNLIIVVLSWFYRRRKKLPPGGYDNVTVGLGNIYYLLLTGAVIFTILGFLGIDAKTLFTSLSIVAAAIAIVTKDYLTEIISGIILSFSNEVSIGDYIKIGDHKGKIVDLNITKTVFLNEDDDIVLIPNFTVFNSEIVNYTSNRMRRVSIDFEVMLDAIKTIEELEADLIDAVKDYHQYIQPDSFSLKIEAIYKDYLTLKFQYTLKQNNRELEKEIRRVTVRRVVNYVKANYEASNDK